MLSEVRLKKNTLGCVLVMLGLFLVTPAQAATITVDSTEDAVDTNPGDGVCATDSGQCTLRAAVQETNALNGPDAIILPAGNYVLAIPGGSPFSVSGNPESGDSGQLLVDHVGDLDVTDDLTLTGSGAGSTVIDGKGAQNRVLHIGPGTVVEIQGVRIQGGTSWMRGGGIATAGTLSLRDCIIADNNSGGAPTSGLGGGIYNSGVLTVVETTIQNNQAVHEGGGIYNEGGTAIISDSTISSNRASGFSFSTALVPGLGGGIYSESGSVTLTRVTVARNRVDVIGGFSPALGSGLLNQGQLIINTSTISDNYAFDLFDNGPAPVSEIENDGVLELRNVSLGGDIDNEGTARLGNTLIAGGCTGTLESLGHNLIADVTGCLLTGGSSGDLTDTAPVLGRLQNNGGLTETRALLPGSPAIDAGDDVICETTDQRGTERPLDGNGDGQVVCDIGAYEADGTEVAIGLAAALLPISRSVQVGDAATVFATLINIAESTALDCGIAPLTNVQAGFSYQTTDPADNTLTGIPDTPVDIAAGGSQSYVVAFTPTIDIPSTDIQLNFDCTNTDPAPVAPGLNTLLLSASSTPVPDIVALVATQSGNGIVELPDVTRVNAFAAAAVNVGLSGDITVTIDTGSAALPVTLSMCESDPVSALCLSPPTSSVTTTINANEPHTFSIFVTGTGTMPFDPARKRIFLYFRDDLWQVRGSTSVAIQIVP